MCIVQKLKLNLKMFIRLINFKSGYRESNKRKLLRVQTLSASDVIIIIP